MSNREIVLWLLRIAHALLDRVPGYWSETQEHIGQAIEEVMSEEGRHNEH